MPPTSPDAFYQAIEILVRNNIPLSKFIRRSFLEHATAASEYMQTFVADLPQLLEWLVHYTQSRDVTLSWMKEHYTTSLMSQIRTLCKAEHGFHFVAKSITAEKMKECNIKNIAEGIRKHAPDVWEVVGSLLQADPVLVRRREKEHKARENARNSKNTVSDGKKASATRDNDDEPNDFWNSVNAGEERDLPDDIGEQLENQRHKLLEVVSTLLLSRYIDDSQSRGTETSYLHQHHDAGNQSEVQRVAGSGRNFPSVV
jgi:hypothetical protein